VSNSINPATLVVGPLRTSPAWNKASEAQREFWEELAANLAAWAQSRQPPWIVDLQRRAGILWTLGEVAGVDLEVARALWRRWRGGWNKLPDVTM
jgi:hypothetical protein